MAFGRERRERVLHEWPGIRPSCISNAFRFTHHEWVSGPNPSNAGPAFWAAAPGDARPLIGSDPLSESLGPRPFSASVNRIEARISLFSARCLSPLYSLAWRRRCVRCGSSPSLPLLVSLRPSPLLPHLIGVGAVNRTPHDVFSSSATLQPRLCRMLRALQYHYSPAYRTREYVESVNMRSTIHCGCDVDLLNLAIQDQYV
ncbi:hypothetical protein DAEQUDRAFT_549302 [Daedalea quercina L-15889]|uniref:Uncharacterized protein n=1 Tax=Daedalea quercina L-15889 TaxID=1314783 RepID=A0A165T323_9APHY|nr:hypothetical protein DAEQUDRAFT_549302 [Daedalea quercina L-15889]